MVSAAPAPENRTPPSAVDWIAQSSVPGTKPRQISLRLRNRQWGCDGSSTGIPQNPEAAQAAKEDGEQGDQEAGVLTERGVGQDQAIRAAFQQNAAQAAIDAADFAILAVHGGAPARVVDFAEDKEAIARGLDVERHGVGLVGGEAQRIAGGSFIKRRGQRRRDQGDAAKIGGGFQDAGVRVVVRGNNDYVVNHPGAGESGVILIDLPVRVLIDRAGVWGGHGHDAIADVQQVVTLAELRKIFEGGYASAPESLNAVDIADVRRGIDRNADPVESGKSANEGGGLGEGQGLLIEVAGFREFRFVLRAPVEGSEVEENEGCEQQTRGSRRPVAQEPGAPRAGDQDKDQTQAGPDAEHTRDEKARYDEQRRGSDRDPFENGGEALTRQALFQQGVQPEGRKRGDGKAGEEQKSGRLAVGPQIRNDGIENAIERGVFTESVERSQQGDTGQKPHPDAGAPSPQRRECKEEWQRAHVEGPRFASGRAARQWKQNGEYGGWPGATIHAAVGDLVGHRDHTTRNRA